MTGCVIIDCEEEANHTIHNPSTGQEANICDTHVVFVPGYIPPNTDEEE